MHMVSRESKRPMLCSSNVPSGDATFTCAGNEIANSLALPLLRKVRTFVETLQRLHVLVPNARMIQGLLKMGVTSAHDIANTADFVDRAERAGATWCIAAREGAGRCDLKRCRWQWKHHATVGGEEVAD